jgi:hypothetical protein
MPRFIFCLPDNRVIRSFQRATFLLPHWSSLARKPWIFWKGTLRLCLYNTVISQNQETESLLCRMTTGLLVRRNIFRNFEHCLRIFPDLCLDKPSSCYIIFSSPKPKHTAGKEEGMQAKPVSPAALCSAPFFSRAATATPTWRSKN